MDYPISIIIPLYNKERHIERALESVFAQTYKNYELIVIDDGSTDNSVNIVEEISRNHDIRIFHEENSGVSTARNKGIAEARYDYIAFLDSDDAWNPMFLEKIVSLINKFPQAGAYVTAYDIIRKEGREYTPRFAYLPKDTEEVLIPNYFISMLYGDPMITSSSVCIKKETFEKAGYFPVEERLGEDKDMWARIALEYPIAFSWYIGATYFENADNRTCLKYIPNYERYFIKTLQKKLDANEVGDEFKEDVIRYISKNLIQLAAKNVKTGNPKFAREILKDERCRLYYKHKIFWFLVSLVPFSVLFLIMKWYKFFRDFKF
jgi:glycosyltransferase involved in cell wall biosynthesis